MIETGPVHRYPPRNPSVVPHCAAVLGSSMLVVSCAAHGRRRILHTAAHTYLRSVGALGTTNLVPPHSVNFVRNLSVQVHIRAEFHCCYDQVQRAGRAERTGPAGCHRYRTQRHTYLRSVGSVLRIVPLAERKLRPKSERASPHPG